MGSVPSLFTAGISEDEAHARATSSITITVARESAPAPPYSSGMCGAAKSAAARASKATCGNWPDSSTSLACGATFASQTARTASRIAWCSSDRANIEYSVLIGQILRRETDRPVHRSTHGLTLGPGLLRERLRELLHLGPQPGVRGCQDAHGEKPGVARVADRDRGNRDTRRHLDYREQRVHPVEVLQRDGHSDHRQWRCLLYTSPSPRDGLLSRMPSSA